MQLLRAHIVAFTRVLTTHLSFLFFSQIWTALDGWVTPATRAFLASPPDAPASPAAGAAPAPAVVLNMSPGEAAAASRRAPPLRPREAEEVRAALAAALDRAMPALRRELGLRVPVGPLDVALQGLLRTFSIRAAMPSLSAPRWTLLALLLAEPLGTTRVPVLGADMASERAHRGVRAIVEAAGFTTAQYAALREPLTLVHAPGA